MKDMSLKFHEVHISFMISAQEAARITGGGTTAESRRRTMKRLFRDGLESNAAMAPDLVDVQITVDGK